MRVAIVILLIAGCARAPLKKREEAMRPTSTPALSDDLEIAPLVGAVRAQIAVLKNGTSPLVFGKRSIPRPEYAAMLERFAALAESSPDKESFFKAVSESFEFHEVYGGDSWAEVLVTSYFEPEIPGSAARTEKYNTPLLRPPPDLVQVMTSKFDDRFKDWQTMRGRVVAQNDKLQLHPYWTRQEIDQGGALSRRFLEIAWADPIDVFFMQVQGSGTVVLDDGRRMRVGYADQNGHKYESIGRFMIDVLPKGKISMQSIETFLRNQTPERMNNYLFRNPSYVFFREREGQPLTMFGTPAVAGRTIATDTRYFPKGALAFLSFERPRFDSESAPEPTSYEKTARFVVDDDTGGAIRGGGRVDLFWGSGAEARRHAGFVKNPGKLYYLTPKGTTP